MNLDAIQKLEEVLNQNFDPKPFEHLPLPSKI
jgi:hypothetical protein